MPQRDGERMKILYEGGSAEITEKKSRFIATVRPVHSEEEAAVFLAEMRKKYWDARHNCSAFVVGDRMQLQRCSDDGEPQGTAGKPMLAVLLGEDVHDVCVIVTRYFGGVLLGTGGLVRAYSKAAQEGLKAGRIIDRIEGSVLRIGTDYNGVGKIQYLLGKRELPITDSVYADSVELETMVPAGELKALKDEITEKTGAKAQFLLEKPASYAIIDGKAVLL